MASAAISAAVTIAKVILEISQDLAQHNQDIARLGQYVKRVMQMLESLQGLVNQQKDRSKTLDLGLEMLVEALQRAQAWLLECKQRSKFAKIFKHSRLLTEFAGIMGDLERALGAIPLGNAHVSVDTLNDVQSLRKEMGQSAKSALQAQEEMMTQLNQQMHLQVEGHTKMDEIKGLLLQLAANGGVSGGPGANLNLTDEEREEEAAALQRELAELKEERQEMRSMMQQMLSALQQGGSAAGAAAVTGPGKPGFQRSSTLKQYAGPHITCPVCKLVMTDPVTLMDTGTNVDLHCIRTRVASGNLTCPVTHQALTPGAMAVPNRALRDMAKTFFEREHSGQQLVPRDSFAPLSIAEGGAARGSTGGGFYGGAAAGGGQSDVQTILSGLRSSNPSPHIPPLAALICASDPQGPPLDPSLRETIATGGAFPPLCAALLHGASPGGAATAVAAAESIARLLEGDRTGAGPAFTAAQSASAALSLVSYLSAQTTAPEGKERAARALAALSVHPASRDAIVSSNGILWLVEMLASGTQSCKVFAARAVRDVIRDPKHRQAASARAPDLLRACAADLSTPGLRDAAAEALGILGLSTVAQAQPPMQHAPSFGLSNHGSAYGSGYGSGYGAPAVPVGGLAHQNSYGSNSTGMGSPAAGYGPAGIFGGGGAGTVFGGPSAPVQGYPGAAPGGGAYPGATPAAQGGWPQAYPGGANGMPPNRSAYGSTGGPPDPSAGSIF